MDRLVPQSSSVLGACCGFRAIYPSPRCTHPWSTPLRSGAWRLPQITELLTIPYAGLFPFLSCSCTNSQPASPDFRDRATWPAEFAFPELFSSFLRNGTHGGDGIYIVWEEFGASLVKNVFCRKSSPINIAVRTPSHASENRQSPCSFTKAILFDAMPARGTVTIQGRPSLATGRGGPYGVLLIRP
jgi:hypothetical protein